MHLYNLTIQRAGGITHAIHGNFSGTKSQEILLAHGKSLELLQPDLKTGRVQSLLAVEIFGIVRSLSSLRLAGTNKDYAVIGTDSGCVVVLEYNSLKNTLEKVCKDHFGKSGCRRKVPGQYLAVDPKGRAVMIGAVEMQKLIYTLTWDAQGRMVLSLPLDLQKANTLTYDMIGIDIESEKPIFACLEVDYTEADADPTGETALKTPQTLAIYEVDTVLNYVARKYSEQLDDHANCLIPVPGGKDGPSGMLLFTENYVTYKHLGFQHDIRCPIPRRRNDIDNVERGMMIICCASYRTENGPVFFVQTEHGDVFRVTLKWDKFVSEVKMRYFETLAPAVSMCFLNCGFLFLAAEFGRHCLYKIKKFGDNTEEPDYSSAIPLDEGDTFSFAPRLLKNLVLIDELYSFSPIISSHFTDMENESKRQLYLLCGRGPRSSVRMLKYGLEVTEIAASELPTNPSGVWAIKKRCDDDFDSFIVVSFVNSTLVLSVGEVVEELSDTGFLGTTSTIGCSTFGYNSLLQVYPGGIRQIRSDKTINEWKPPAKKTIIKCAINQRQVVVALSGKELIYFEMDSAGELKHLTERKDLPAETTCMALGSVPIGQPRSRFLALVLTDNTVRIMSVEPPNILSGRSMQSILAPVESLCVVEMGRAQTIENDSLPVNEPLCLYVGLKNGMLMRINVNNMTGGLEENCVRYVGVRPVKVFKVKIKDSNAILATSNQSWLSYYRQNRFHSTPLLCECLEYVSGITSQQCKQGIISISAKTLRILQLEPFGSIFSHTSLPLEYTPRRFAIHPDTNRMLIAECDSNAFSDDGKMKRKKELVDEIKDTAGDDDKDLEEEMANVILNDVLPESIFSAPKAGDGTWASQLKIIDPTKGQIINKIQLKQNEAIVSMALVKFSASIDGRYFLAVGVVKELQMNRKCNSASSIDLYKIDQTCSHLEFVHRTEMDDLPGALCAFHGRLLAGIGNMLRIYDIGKKKLLRKCENKNFPNQIVNIQAMDHRIYVADAVESVFFAHYKQHENQIIVVADDTLPQWITSSIVLDYETVATADKFGNISVLRLPFPISDKIEDSVRSTSMLDDTMLTGSSQKLDILCRFHIGDIVTSLLKAKLSAQSSECVIYTTLNGSIGALIPFRSNEEFEFFKNVELQMRNENPPLCGRNHLNYRSWYYDVKNVVDGDLCEQFNFIDVAKQKSIAIQLRRSVADMMNRIEDIRSQHYF